MIYHNLFFGLDKNELLLFNRQELLQKAKDRYHNGGGKENLLSTILKTKKFWEKTQKNKYGSLYEETRNKNRIWEK